MVAPRRFVLGAASNAWKYWHIACSLNLPMKQEHYLHAANRAIFIVNWRKESSRVLILWLSTTTDVAGSHTEIVESGWSARSSIIMHNHSNSWQHHNLP